MKTNQRQIRRICTIQMIVLCIFCLICTALHISDDVPNLISISVISVGSLLIFLWLRGMCSDLSLGIIYGGYILRIFCLIIDLYGRKYFTLVHSGTDSEGFFSMAVQYYNGDYSGYYTWYPYVVRGIFAIFGQNRLLAQYVNIIFWVFMTVLILKICHKFHVPERKRLIACCLLAFLPNSIFLSSILMRESIMIFFDVCGLYFMIAWMKGGKFRDLFWAFLLPIPAIILHTASIGIWVGFALVTAVWSGKHQKYMISTKTGFILTGFVIFICILFFTDLKNIFMSYFNEDLSIYAITHRYFAIGGSDYLSNMDYQYWYQLIPFTLVRMFYFVCSPIITECRGLQDYLCILGDVIPTIFVMINICMNMRRKKFSRYAFAGVLCYVITVGIFAWGTANAGTAMRHRGLLWGILVASYCIGFGREESGQILL